MTYYSHYELNIAQTQNPGARFPRWEHWAKVVLPNDLNEQEATTRALAIKMAIEVASPGAVFSFRLRGVEPVTSHEIALPVIDNRVLDTTPASGQTGTPHSHLD